MIEKLFKNKIPSVSYAKASRIGQRECNEDALIALEREDRYCFVVADGLGGHKFGSEASKRLTEVFSQEFGNGIGNRQFLARTFGLAQKEILALQKEKDAIHQMKTTAVALSISGSKCAWGHVGDSRLYHFKNGAFAKRTLDHSVPQVYAAAGEIKGNEIPVHPARAHLLRVFGNNWDEPKYELSKEISLGRDAAFLLCTDGVWEYFTDDGQLAPGPGMDAVAWLSALLDHVERTGQNTEEMDNYTAITIMVEG